MQQLAAETLGNNLARLETSSLLLPFGQKGDPESMSDLVRDTENGVPPTVYTSNFAFTTLSG